MKVHIKRSFDSSCSTYDSSCDIQRLVASHLISLCGKTASDILEIGTGTGIYTDELADKYPSADITCLDISCSLLEGAKAKYPNYSFVCADGENIPLKGCYDLVTGSSTLQWFENPAESIPQMLSLLKPGGRFAFSIFVEGTFVEMSILNKMTGFGSVYDLLPDSSYRDIFKEFKADFDTREYVLFFDDAREFLKKQKGTGATFTGVSRFASKSSYKKFIELYPELFGDGGKVPVTYKILYISGSV